MWITITRGDNLEDLSDLSGKQGEQSVIQPTNMVNNENLVIDNNDEINRNIVI